MWGTYLVSSLNRSLPFAILNVTSAHVRINLLDDRAYLVRATSDLVFTHLREAKKRRTSFFSGDIVAD